MRTLIAIPVYNEQAHVTRVLEAVRQYATDVLVIDDGSIDETPLLLARQPVDVVRHARNRGYGQCMIDAFRWGSCYRFDWLVTMDCDEQHEASNLPDFYQAIERNDADVISGSRYLRQDPGDDLPPPERQAINSAMTKLFNDKLGLCITDGFCGYKAYRVESVARLELDEQGYAFPIQFWVQAAAKGLRVKELPLRLIYNDPNRTFGGQLDDAQCRLAHYRSVFNMQLAQFPRQFDQTCSPRRATEPSRVDVPVTPDATAQAQPT